jgi:1,5-anhydro-D-fructose reductase (1,5-anhydro-D-mannitol-forming)
MGGTAKHLAGDTVRWGIIGCGDVCEIKSGPGFQKAEGSRLVAVMRRDRARAEDFARRHAVPRAYDDAAALIADPEVDAVYIATPPSTHAPYALQVAAAGVPLFVAYYRRSLPRFQRVKALLAEGAIGTPCAVHMVLCEPPRPGHLPPSKAAWRLDPAIAGAGLFLDLGSHMLDLLDHLLGPITQARGAAVNRAGLYAAEDTIAAQLAFEGGAVGSATWSFVTGVKLDRTEILGTAGKLTYACFEDAPIVLETAAGRQEIPIPHPPHVQQPLIQTIVDQLRGRGRAASDGESGLRATAVMDEILSSYRARTV